MYITVAGRSNALSGFADANVVTPVIICPPYSSTFSGADLFSSIRMPSGVCPMLVLEPEGAALAAAKILAVGNEAIANQIRKLQKVNQQSLYVADSDIRTKSYFATIDAARSNTLSKTNLDGINTTNLYVGKVRDRFESGDKVV